MTRYSIALFCLFSLLFSQTVDEIANYGKLDYGTILESKTRLDDNELKTFRLKVLASLPSSRPGEDAIMAEILGEAFREIGVLAGMSGSPVYLSNKIIGAVAYTTTDLKKPIVGITLIEPMLRTLQVLDNDKKPFEYPSIQAGGLVQVQMPLASSLPLNFDSEFLTAMNPLGANSTLTTLASGKVSPEGEEAIRDIRAGDMLAVALVTGDLQLAAFGTVSYRSNDQLLAFGHPFSSLGKTSLPVYSARAEAAISRTSLGYKLSSLGVPIGRMINDSSTAIAVELGKEAGSIPVQVGLQAPYGDKSLQFQVADDPRLYPSLIPLSLAASLKHYSGGMEEGNMLAEVKLSFENGETLEYYEDIASAQLARGAENLAASLAMRLRWLENNFYGPAYVLKSANIKAHFQAEFKYWRLLSVQTSTPSLSPGEDLEIQLNFRANTGEEKRIKHRVTLPPQIQREELQLIISSASEFWQLDQMLNPGKHRIRERDDVMELARGLPNARDYSLWMLSEEGGLALAGEKGSHMPEGALEKLSIRHYSDIQSFFYWYKEDHRLDAPVLGFQALTIKIDQKGRQEIYEK